MNDLLSTVKGSQGAPGRGPQVYDIEAGYTTAQSKRTKEMDEFFVAVDEVKRAIAAIKTKQREIQRMHEQSKTIVRKADMQQHRSEVQAIINEVNALAHQAKAKLEQVDKLNTAAQQKKGQGVGSASERTRTSITSGLKKKLKDLMGEFSDLRARIHDENRQVVERRVYAVTGQHLPEDDIDRMIETGQAETIFQTAILEQGRGRVLDTLAEIQERNRAVKDLEASLMELHQIFLDMAVLVEAQGEMLDNIEKQVSRSVEYVQSGTTALQDAKQLQKKTRKWMCCAIILLLVTAAVIVVVDELAVQTVYADCSSNAANGNFITERLGTEASIRVNEEVVLTAADRLVSLGLAEAGYNYLNLDDCWHSRSRTADNSLQADPLKFPSGMKALADAVHQRGLKFGIYSDAGLFTCAGYPGSRYHETTDASLFASWGVDYLKYDNCFAPDYDIKERYQDMRDALNKTGRPIYFSMCNWGVASPWEWGPATGNSWRTDADIAANWDAVLRSLDNGAAGLSKFAGPGGWNDPDMLEVGVGSLTLQQQRSHFALWALVKAPLLIGANLATISSSSLAILKAKEVIAINQDDLGIAGDIIYKEGPIEIWAGPLSGNARAVVLFNRHIAGPPTRIRVTWAQLGYTGRVQGSGFQATVRDLYAERELGVFEDGFECDVAPHDSAVLKITPVIQPAAKGSIGDGSSSSSSQRSSSSCGCTSLKGGVSLIQKPGMGSFQHLAEAARCLVAAWRCSVQQKSGAVSDGGMDSKQHHHHQQQQHEVTWRPWHHPDAAKAQAAKRAAAMAYQATTRHSRQRMQRRAGAQSKVAHEVSLY